MVLAVTVFTDIGVGICVGVGAVICIDGSFVVAGAVVGTVVGAGASPCVGA